MDTRIETASIEGPASGATPAAACCGSAEQAVCCAPEAKGSCCGEPEKTTAGQSTQKAGCGCR